MRYKYCGISRFACFARNKFHFTNALLWQRKRKWQRSRRRLERRSQRSENSFKKTPFKNERCFLLIICNIYLEITSYVMQGLSFLLSSSHPLHSPRCQKLRFCHGVLFFLDPRGLEPLNRWIAPFYLFQNHKKYDKV